MSVKEQIANYIASQPEPKRSDVQRIRNDALVVCNEPFSRDFILFGERKHSSLSHFTEEELQEIGEAWISHHGEVDHWL